MFVNLSALLYDGEKKKLPKLWSVIKAMNDPDISESDARLLYLMGSVRDGEAIRDLNSL